uniref:Uncharacterized protein n=1 Tax=Arundo donax TaxID=35708 RepID=A0A0A8YDF5_ARUDO
MCCVIACESSELRPIPICCGAGSGGPRPNELPQRERRARRAAAAAPMCSNGRSLRPRIYGGDW